MPNSIFYFILVIEWAVAWPAPAGNLQASRFDEPLERAPGCARIRRSLAAYLVAPGARMVDDIVEKGLFGQEHETIHRLDETHILLIYIGISDRSRNRFAIVEAIERNRTETNPARGGMNPPWQ